MSRNSRAIFQGPTSLTERQHLEVEQCIARRWTDFMVKVANECRVNLADVLKVARDMDAAADAVDGESPSRRGLRPGLEHQPCGTQAAYERHRRAREEPCQPCKTAHAEDCLTRNQRRRAARHHGGAA